eukprot:2612040-Prymnesium_polylepis.1
MSAPGTDTAILEPALLDGAIALVTLDHHPVNSLSLKLGNALIRIADELRPRIAAGEVRGVVLRGAGRYFSAGADITQFGSADGEER